MGRSAIKLFSFIAVLTILYVFLFPFNAEATAINTGPYTWSLDSKNDKNARILPAAVSLMEKNHGPGDDGQSGRVTLNAGSSYIWITDQVTENDITVPSGIWILQIVTDSDWGTKGNKCQIEIGEWDGSFTPLTHKPLPLETWGAQSLVVVSLFQSTSLTIGENKHLALRVTNLEDKLNHVIHTGENQYCSFLRSPETYTTTPLPEMESGILLIIGIAGLATFVILKRKSII